MGPPRRVHRCFEPVGRRHRLLDPAHVLRLQRREEAGREQGLQHRRLTRQGACELGCEGQDLHDQAEQLGLGQEQRLHLHARGEAGEEVREAVEGRVRRARGMGGVEQPGRQAGEQLPAALAAGGVDAAVMPGADRRGDLARVGKAHPLEGGEGLGVVLHAGEDQAAEARGQGLLSGEQLSIAAVHGPQGAAHLRVEGPQRAEAGQRRHAPSLGVGLGQAVGLLVPDHLDPVLPGPKPVVARGQLPRSAGGDVARALQGAEGVQGAA